MADDDAGVSTDASQGTALWLGDGTCAGVGASDAAHRYSTLTSKALGLVEANHAATGVGFATEPDVGSQVDAASKLGLAGVAYVFLMAGITDSYDSLGSMRSATAAAVRAAARHGSGICTPTPPAAPRHRPHRPRPCSRTTPSPLPARVVSATSCSGARPSGGSP